MLEESVTIMREVGDVSNLANGLNNLGVVATRQADFGLAHSFFAEALAIRRGVGDKQGIAECLEGIAGSAVEESEYEFAAVLFGAAKSIREGIGAPMAPVDRPDFDRAVETLQAHLGAAQLAAISPSGRRWAGRPVSWAVTARRCRGRRRTPRAPLRLPGVDPALPS